MEIFPSIISSDLLNLEKTLKELDPVADGYHIDVMDNHFVPNLTWGPDFVNAISKKTKLPLCIHLMVDDPEGWLNKLDLDTDDYFVFHYESLKNENDVSSFITKVKEKGYKVGIAISPETPIEKIFNYLNDIDQVTLMSVNPGFSGQKFIPEVVDKVESLVKYRDDNNITLKICMDGGINRENIKMLSEKGVERFAIASTIFSSDDPASVVKSLKE